MLIRLRGTVQTALGRKNPALNHPWSSKVNYIFIIAALWPPLNLSSEYGDVPMRRCGR